MNNFKRITALTVLCFMLCSFFTCTGISENEKVFASDGENYDESGTEILNVLGISADIKNSDSVTRGEFAELLGKALRCGGEFLPDEDPFKDVYNYDLKSGYIYALKQLGVVCGDENGKFNKNREITFEEACMMSLRALNYKNQLSDPRVFSYQLARNVGLTKGTGLSSGDVLSKDNALLVVFNMLNCDIPHLTSIEDGYADYNIISGITLLGEIWELYKTEGILRKTRVTDLYTLSDIAEEGYIKIGETVFHDNSGFSKDMLGRNVICYANADNEAAYIYSSKNSYMNISENSEPSFGGFKISYYNGSRKTDVTLSAKYTVIYNRRVLENKLSGKLKENSSLRLVDNDRDGKYDVVFITERTYGALKNVTDDGGGKIIFSDLNGSLNNTAINDTACDYAELYLNGAPCEVSDLKEGLVLSREISKDGKCVKLYASDLKTGGTIEKISEKDGKTYYKTENGEYEASSYFVKYYGGKIRPGSRTEIYLSDDGKAVYASDGAEIYSYGYVMAAAYEKKGMDKKLLVKLLTQSGDKNKYAVADKIVLDGKSVQRESAAVKNVFLPDGKNPYQVIKYSLNSEGEINKVDSENSNSAYEKYSDNTDKNDSLLKYMSKRSI